MVVVVRIELGYVRSEGSGWMQCKLPEESCAV